MSAEDCAAGHEIVRNIELALGDGSTVTVYLRGQNEALPVVRVQRNGATVRLEGTGNSVHDVAYSAIAAARYLPRTVGSTAASTIAARPHARINDLAASTLRPAR